MQRGTSLSSIQAVLEEERDDSRLKLVVCGSAVAQMEALQSERNPLHARLIPLELRPLPFARASLLLDAPHAYLWGRRQTSAAATGSSKPLGPAILRDLEEFKLPALTQSGFKMAGKVTTVLFSTSGYTAALRGRADLDEHLVLVDVENMLSAK